MKTIKNKLASHGLPLIGAIIAGATLAGGIAFADTGPVISSVSASPTTNGATITWMTDQGANAQVMYGTASASTTPYTASTTVTSGFASTSQSVVLTGLNPHTTYFYTVASGNASGTYTSSSERTFMTLPLQTTGTISLNPSSGMPGSMFSVTGMNFTPFEGITLMFENATSSATANASGTFTTTLAVPNSAASGTAQVTATGGTSNSTASQWFTVEAMQSTTTATSTPDLATLQSEITQLQNLVNQLIAEIQGILNHHGNGNGNGNGNNGNGNGNGGSYPSSTLQATIDRVIGPVRAGTTVNFTGRNWGTNEQIKVMNNGNTVTTAQADGGGNFSTGSLPVSGTPGNETYTFTGLSSGLTRSVTITITP